MTKRIKCLGGLDNCKNYVGDYKDVEGVVVVNNVINILMITRMTLLGTNGASF